MSSGGTDKNVEILNGQSLWGKWVAYFGVVVKAVADGKHRNVALQFPHLA